MVVMRGPPSDVYYALNRRGSLVSNLCVEKMQHAWHSREEGSCLAVSVYVCSSSDIVFLHTMRPMRGPSVVLAERAQTPRPMGIVCMGLVGCQQQLVSPTRWPSLGYAKRRRQACSPLCFHLMTAYAPCHPHSTLYHGIKLRHVISSATWTVPKKANFRLVNRLARGCVFWVRHRMRRGF